MREKTGHGSNGKGLGCRLGRLAHRSLAIVLSSLLVFQPMLANAQSVSASTTAPAGNQPGVGAAPNGVPLIDIVTPNSKGLSHNKYDNFNVGTPGLILNNFKGEIGNSSLGGVTPGNPNLNTSGPATVILNEVTSGNRSALNGPTEVFGGRADVIIANPNGITCDGCGFINTPHATLTTGAPQIGADGRLNGFTVNGGDVTIGPNGGNFAAGSGAVDLFDIVSRNVHVNGPVYGKSLRVTAGASNFDYATGDSQALAPITGTPEYAIDGTALGAMQADRIKIVVTEQGAGVRMSGNLAANVNELSLSADGKISLGNVSGEQGVSISSKAKVSAAKVTSKAKVDVQAEQGITLDTVAADGDIALSSGSGLLSVGGEVNSAGNVEMSSAAGISAGSVVAGNALTLSATASNIQIAGEARSGDALTFTATSGSISAASLVSGTGLTLSAGVDIGISGDVLAQGNVTATGRSIAAATLASGVDFAATAQSANGTLALQQAGDMSLTATNGSILVGDALLSSGNLSATASQNIAYGQLQSLGNAGLTASGQISYGNPTSATGNLAFTTTNVDLANGAAGNIAVGGTLTFNADSADLSNNSLTFGGLALNLTGTADLSGATINAISDAGGSGDIAINAGGLSTSAGTALLAADDLTLTLPSLTNAGQLAAGDDLTLNISGNFTNSATGLAYAGNDARLFIGGVLTNNQGAILAGDDLEIAGTASGLRNSAVTNISGLIQAGNDMSVLTGNLTNERTAAPQWTTGVLVSSGIVSGFTLNPAAAGLPFGYLETADQNMYQLYAGVDPGLWQDYQPLLWSKATLSDGTTYRAWTWISADGPEKVGPIIDWIRARVPRDANGNPVADPNNPSRYFIVDEVNFSGSDESTTYTWDWSSHLSQSVYEDRLTGTLSPEATIRASRDLTIDATNLTNAYSSIEAGGDATLKGSTLTNTGVTLFRTTTTTCSAQGACTAYDASGHANPSKNIANGTTIVSSVQAIGGVSANIKAGGALSVDFGSVNNTSAAGSMAGGVSVAAPSDPGDPLSALSGLTAGGALFNVNSGLGTTLVASTNPQAGGFGKQIPGQTFLFETRAEFLDVGTFYGSAYFMDRIGYQPDTTIPFLGDAYFENQLIEKQIQQLAGQGLGPRSFIPGSDATEQVKTLLDNGADYARDNHLQVGQALTPEAVAALTKPVVLYQKQVVNGIEVWAPVVYLPSTATAQLTASGALMSGSSVTIGGGAINNSGAMVAVNDLSVSGSSIASNGGSFKSGKDVSLSSSGALTLNAQSMDLGGQAMVNPNAAVTAGGNATLAAAADLTLKGAAVNATGNASLTGKNVTLDAVKVDNAGQQNATGSQVASGGSLTIKATDNVNVIGSSAKAGTTLDVTADNGSVAVVSTDVARDNQSGYTKTLSTDQQQSQLSSGTNATIKAGDDILLSGSSVKAKGNVALSAGDDINITAAQEHSASTFGKKSASSITHVGSEISAAGDLSVTAGNSTGDHDLNIVGSQVAADGKVGLKAFGDVTIAEATDTATLDTKLSLKGGFLGKSEKTTTHLETTTAVGSAITGAGGVDIESGKDTVISASKIEAGKETTPANLNITTGGDLVIASGKDTSAKDDKGSRSGFLSKGSSTYKSYDETTVASELGASGNISLNAGGAAVIAGSKANADGSINVVGDSVSVIGAAEQHELEISRKKSGLFVGSGDGFISLWGAEQKSGKQASELNVASVLSAGTDLALKSRDTDVNILGSQIYADNNITLDAARDVNITPGAESESSQEKEKRSGFGISFGSNSGGFSVGIGVSSVSDTTKQGSQTNAMATLSAGNELTIDAGRDANLQAADVSADRDVAITAERDVNLLSAEDKSNYESVHEQFFAGVTLSVSSGLVSAASNAIEAASKVGDGSTSRSIAHVAIAGIEAYSVLDALTNQDAAKEFAKLQNGQSSVFASASLTAGFQYSKSSEKGFNSDPVSTAIRGGNSVTIEATSGNLVGSGAQILAGYDADGMPNGKAGDIALIAGQDVILQSAQATTSNSTRNSSGGVQVDLVNPGVSFNYGKGSSNGSSVTQVNSHVVGAGEVFFQSGNDTKLQGAVVSGESFTADVGHDLIIESQLDTTSQKANQFGIGGSFGGGSALGLNGSLQKATGSAALVSEQSGIHAGSGGFDITVSNKTALMGGLITSRAPATQNLLETGTLEFNGLDTHSKWKADSYSGGLTLTGPLLTPPMHDGESATGQALSAISPGQIIITDPAHQTQNVDDLRRDTSNTNTSLPGIPELQDILREQLKTQELYQDAAAKAAKFIGDFALKRERAATTDEERAFWAEGGPGRAALHALAGGLLGGVTDVSGMIRGALGGATSSLLGPYIRDLVAEIVNGTSLAGTAQGEQLINIISASLVQGLAATVGGGEGAAYAGNAFKYNYLTHKELEEANKEQADLEEKIAACKASLENGCTAQTLVHLENDLQLSVAHYRQLSDANNAALVQACAASLASYACVNGRRDLQNAVDEEYGLQAHVLGTSGVNTPDALLLGVLNDAVAGHMAPDQIANQYKQALITNQKLNAGVALALLAVAGVAVAPETYTACLLNPAVCNELLIALGELSAGDALAGTTLAPTVNVVAGMLVLRKGDEVIGIVDEATGKTVQLAGDELEVLEQTLSAQVTMNRQNGVTFEEQIVEALNHVGAAKNDVPVTVSLKNGKEVTTIPDLWDKTVGGILEAKNVKYLANSDQLRAQLRAAEVFGQPFNLVVSPNTRLTKPLEREIRRINELVGGGIYRFDPATGLMTDF